MPSLAAAIHQWKAEDCQQQRQGLRRAAASIRWRFCWPCGGATAPDALAFVDVTRSEHWAAEAFTVPPAAHLLQPDRQPGDGLVDPGGARGRSGVFRAGRCVTVTGDGCFLMSAMEISTAAREGLPVKFFVLDDQAYHYMQALQRPAYLRTTATILARLDYAALAQGWGSVITRSIAATTWKRASRRSWISGPVLVQVVTDYGKRPIRWIDAARKKYVKELSREQKVRFLARVGSRL